MFNRQRRAELAHLRITNYELRIINNVRLAPSGTYVRRTIYDMGVRRLRRELDEREDFLRTVIMITAHCDRVFLGTDGNLT